ncbi:hypothetical protein HRUBRA_02868 [Pseudohaliea rubra DSM 19751]|uniref:Uncharacterized protein n=1 Tax=Pseudohaliea rubra DSM 19751 TaxID=1265313 RepID=A0A095VNE9_9GAMM|nr:hypothetical protein HRUBRA_02868 [Pseudohaliea rubra DSM 19751]
MPFDLLGSNYANLSDNVALYQLLIEPRLEPHACTGALIFPRAQLAG